MKHHRIKIITAILGAVMLFAACGKDKDGIIGEWQWTGTTVHHTNAYMGFDTTYTENYPFFKDLAFHENNTVDVLQQGAFIPEEEPHYHIYQYDYSLNAAGDTILLSDPQDAYYTQPWPVKTLTKESLTLEYTWEGGDYAGIDVYTTTATYRRR